HGAGSGYAASAADLTQVGSLLGCPAKAHHGIAAVPLHQAPQEAPQSVAVEAFERLLDKTDDPAFRTYLLAGWLAGLRLGEAAALEWEPTSMAPYLDLPRNRIIFPAEFVKGVEDQWVPLDLTLREAPLALPVQGRKVFCFRDSRGKLLSASGLTKRIARLAREAGVTLDMGSLRRGFACRYASKVS